MTATEKGRLFRRSDRTSTERRSSIALAFAFLTTVALVAVPWAGVRHSRPIYSELSNIIAPARGLVTRISVALAVEGSLLRDYVASHDEGLTARFREAYALELGASAQLKGLVDSLGAAPRRALAEFQREQREWHALIDRFFAAPSTLDVRDPLRGRNYEDLLNAAVRLDLALETAGQSRRAAIRRAEHAQAQIAVALGVLGLGAALAIVWLARRLHVYASTLEERRAELERAIESRARLMRGVTHDLKNPLHTIDGHAQLLEDEVRGPLLPDQRDSIFRVRRSVKSLLALIEDLLDLGRAETGQLRVTPQQVDIAGLVMDTLEQHRPMAVVSGHALTVADLPPSLPAVTDPSRVRQVLGNLLSNAVKYTPRGGRITVRVDARERKEGGESRSWIAITVSDNGDGVPAEQQEAIFADFTRLEAHEGIPGAGLGLSISRRISQLLGGDLTLQSVPGMGATFTLWLPRDGQREPDSRADAFKNTRLTAAPR